MFSVSSNYKYKDIPFNDDMMTALTILRNGDIYNYSCDWKLLFKQLKIYKCDKNRLLFDIFENPSKSTIKDFTELISNICDLKTHVMMQLISHFLLLTVYRFVQTHKQEFQDFDNFLLNKEKEKVKKEEEEKEKNKKELEHAFVLSKLKNAEEKIEDLIKENKNIQNKYELILSNNEENNNKKNKEKNIEIKNKIKKPLFDRKIKDNLYVFINKKCENKNYDIKDLPGLTIDDQEQLKLIWQEFINSENKYIFLDDHFYDGELKNKIGREYFYQKSHIDFEVRFV